MASPYTLTDRICRCGHQHKKLFDFLGYYNDWRLTVSPLCCGMCSPHPFEVLPHATVMEQIKADLSKLAFIVQELARTRRLERAKAIESIAWLMVKTGVKLPK